MFMLLPAAILACLIGGYLLGSIPFGLLITRFAKAGDLRQIGSGNIGATNVLRTGRKDLALLTLLGDGGKGAVAVLVARALWGDDAGALAGGAAFLGHLFPVWLKFRGGKGVATFFGVMLAAAWPAGIACAATWIAMAAVFRYSSLAALTAAALAPVYALGTQQPRSVAALALIMAVLIYVRHRENIQRLMEGRESRIGKGGPAGPAGSPPT
ncbi:MAG TPA: glycerol-3-phosphate 1-O-acyltransferase PlsY [Caulobacteraceae bacterium]|jgi:glycerol-3-phosphate acyltransferase PlsY|nr:glycerol-3-phosphate 1-O-acyltransferase PlsY [Caulobacteraceae bacterium]